MLEKTQEGIVTSHVFTFFQKPKNYYFLDIYMLRYLMYVCM